MPNPFDPLSYDWLRAPLPPPPLPMMRPQIPATAPRLPSVITPSQVIPGTPVTAGSIPDNFRLPQPINMTPRRPLPSETMIANAPGNSALTGIGGPGGLAKAPLPADGQSPNMVLGGPAGPPPVPRSGGIGQRLGDFFRSGDALRFGAGVLAGDTLPEGLSLGFQGVANARDRRGQTGKPTSAMQEYQLARQQGYQGSFLDFQKELKAAGKTSINNVVNTAQDSFADQFGKANADVFLERRAAAEDAARSLEASTEARQLLDSGIISGTGADRIVSAGKALQRMGVNIDPDPIANTEAFAATRAQEVGRIIKLFGAGTGLSDADREFATKAAAGQITMNEQSIRRILDINDRAARNVIANFNAEAETVPPEMSPWPLTVEPPAPYAPSPTTGGAPMLGAIEDGYRFRGGDPSNPANWERVR